MNKKEKEQLKILKRDGILPKYNLLWCSERIIVKIEKLEEELQEELDRYIKLKKIKEKE